MPRHSGVLCFTADYLVCPALVQVTTVERRSCGSCSTWRPLGLLSRPPGTTHISHYYIISICYCDFVVLFCTSNIYCLSVHPGRGIPPSVAPPEVSSIFFPPLLKVFYFKFFVAIHCTDCLHHSETAEKKGLHFVYGSSRVCDRFHPTSCSLKLL